MLSREDSFTFHQEALPCLNDRRPFGDMCIPVIKR